MSETSYPPSDKNQVTRLPKRGSLDREIIYPILDEALVVTLAFVENGEPRQIPTGFVRAGDAVYIHGSVGSHFMRLFATGIQVCGTVTLLDALVMAKSAFHHSMNYRSVVFWSIPEVVKDEAEQTLALEAFTNKLKPNRWNETRKPNASEWRKTMVLRLPLLDASAKVRSGPPSDDEEDLNLPYWAGLIPLNKGYGDPQPF